MLIKAYLVIDDLELVIKDYSMEIGKYVDRSNYPGVQKGQHRGFHIEVVAPQNNLLWEEAIKNYSMTPLMQIRFEPAIVGSEKTRIISMYDCHVVSHRVSYHHQDNEPLTEQVHITCGGVEDSWFSGTVYDEHWRVTYPSNGVAAVEEDGEEEDENPIEFSIKSITWLHNKYNKSLKSVEYSEKVRAAIKVKNIEIGEGVNLELYNNKMSC